MISLSIPVFVLMILAICVSCGIACVFASEAGRQAKNASQRLANAPDAKALDKLLIFIDEELRALQYSTTGELSRSIFGLRDQIQLAYAKAKGELPQ